MRQALEMALEALEVEHSPIYGTSLTEKAIIAIKEALAQPEQEPVAWPKTPAEISDMIGSSYVWREHKISDVEPHESDKYCVTAHDLLEAFENWNEYTTPPQRKPLTDEEIQKIVLTAHGNQDWTLVFARAIEAAHGIKELKND